VKSYHSTTVELAAMARVRRWIGGASAASAAGTVRGRHLGQGIRIGDLDGQVAPRAPSVRSTAARRRAASGKSSLPRSRIVTMSHGIDQKPKSGRGSRVA
jgi:hypothetical protein